MRGRDAFRRVRPLLRFGRFVLGLLPRCLCQLLWELLRHLPLRVGIGLRYVVLSRLAASCGDNVAVFEGVHLFRLEHLRMGSNVSIHPMCYLDATGGITMGDDVAIAHATTVMTTEHDYRDAAVPTRDAEGYAAPVEIGSDVWIGAGVRILAGVRIGSHSVVAAGAVVTRDVAAHSLVAGVPARPLKAIREAAV